MHRLKGSAVLLENRIGRALVLRDATSSPAPLPIWDATLGWGLAGINIDNDGWTDLANPFRRGLATPNAC